MFAVSSLKLVDQVGVEPTSPAARGYSPLGLPMSRLIQLNRLYQILVRIEGVEPTASRFVAGRSSI